MELILLSIITTLSLALCAYQAHTAKQERATLIAQLTAKDQDMLDRLMAKDLPEVKQAQKPPAEGHATSKRRNEQHLTEKNKKLAGM